MRDFRSEALRITLEEIAKGAAQFEFFSQVRSLEPIAITRTLHHRTIKSFLLARKHRNSENAFIADNRYFYRFATGGMRQQGNDAGSGEIYQIQFASAFINDPSLREAYRFKAESHPFIRVFGKHGEEKILFGSMKV